MVTMMAGESSPVMQKCFSDELKYSICCCVLLTLIVERKLNLATEVI
jgi:hypothetical protein